jgi:phage N-6-adenine-methyltransferase
MTSWIEKEYKDDFSESNIQEYETPDNLFNILDKEFNFTLDVCANEINHKVKDYFTEQDNALIKTWDGICWMNPPFKNKEQWVIKAYKESRKETCIVAGLIPARTNTNWWHKYCMTSEIRFLKGRPIFKGCKYGLPAPLAVVVFGKNYIGSYKSVIF